MLPLDQMQTSVLAGTVTIRWFTIFPCIEFTVFPKVSWLLYLVLIFRHELSSGLVDCFLVVNLSHSDFLLSSPFVHWYISSSARATIASNPGDL